MKTSGMSKGRALEYVGNKLTLFQVPDLVNFSIVSFKIDSSTIIQEIQTRFQGKSVAIRSSAFDEDRNASSAAGEYDSILGVNSLDVDEIRNGVNVVIKSIENKRPISENDEFFVQEMIQNCNISGVVFTHDLNTGAPYYVVNYDDTSGLTNTVTAGSNDHSNRSLFVYRQSTKSLRSPRFVALIDAVIELQDVVLSEFIDVEFALTEDLQPFLLQVRPMTNVSTWGQSFSTDFDKRLQLISEFIKSRQCSCVGLFGDMTVYGQMPDWNPVEMIGRAPRALAFSLYRRLITDDAWRVARERMGYAIPAGQPLMVSLAGQPFIDTRISFQSFLPNSINTKTGKKLVNAWVKRLEAEPTLHDKVEFEVAITSFSFDIDEKIEKLIGDELTDNEKTEFRAQVLDHTRSLITGAGEWSLSGALNKLKKLESKQSKYNARLLSKNIAALFQLIDDCINLGSVPFAILARHGFIAKTILLSLQKCGVFTEEEVIAFQANIKTVATDYVKDSNALQSGELSKEQFLTRYGHLRPGTYDIRSKRYDQTGQILFDTGQAITPSVADSFEINSKQKTEIDKLLSTINFGDFGADDLIDYIEAAIVGREYGKFIFSRSVSEILEVVANFGHSHGIDREGMSHISIEDILGLLINSQQGKPSDYLRFVSKQNQKAYALTNAIRLPQLLSDPKSVFVVPFQVNTPNFITHKKVSASINFLQPNKSFDNIAIAGKIVLIESADPGFDWIFTQEIAGLITKYGGANSHMAIRCAEFSLPAAIGCGEKMFESLLSASQVTLDCAAGLVNIVR